VDKVMEQMMAVELKQHIELRGDDPLDAVIAGTTRIKAYLVANLAINDGVEAAMKQYTLTAGAVHAALAFYYDNQEAIRQANEAVMQQLWDMGMQDMDDFREKILHRQQLQNESENPS
jgi:uncharacterized protein (DUF433 family)